MSSPAEEAGWVPLTTVLGRRWSTGERQLLRFELQSHWWGELWGGELRTSHISGSNEPRAWQSLDESCSRLLTVSLGAGDTVASSVLFLCFDLFCFIRVLLCAWCVRVACIYSWVPAENRNPWHWSYELFQATMWMLGTNARFPARATRAPPRCWAFSLISSFVFWPQWWKLGFLAFLLGSYQPWAHVINPTLDDRVLPWLFCKWKAIGRNAKIDASKWLTCSLSLTLVQLSHVTGLLTFLSKALIWTTPSPFLYLQLVL